jgi:predicted amidohydrolase YtcJ
VARNGRLSHQAERLILINKTSTPRPSIAHAAAIRLRRMRRVVPLALLLVLVVGAGIAWLLIPEPPPPFATWKSNDVYAIVNARVLTLDASGRVADAVAIRDGRIVAVGSTAEVQRLVEGWGDRRVGVRRRREWGPRVIDAGGRTVIPGLIDSHVHALMVAAAEAKQPFAGLSSIAEIQDWIRKEAARVPAGTWIWSPRIFPTRVREHRFPTREELDAAAPDHPVAIDGAYAWMVNSAALKAADITSATSDPPGGAIVKDASGQPTGLLRNVGTLLSRFQNAADDTVSPDMLDRVHEAYSRAGITSVIERGATMDGWRAYEALRARRQRTGLPLQVRAAVTIRIPQPTDATATEQWVQALPFRPGEGDEWLAARQLKIVVDGGILAGTAYMREPYGLESRALYGVDDPNYRGLLTLTPEQIASAIAIGHRHGWQMVAHVTGDAGVDTVLDAIEAAQASNPAIAKERRHTLLHAYFANAEAAARAARLGVPIDTQPAWYYKDADALVPALGAPRLEHFIGIRTWLDGGAHVSINTDHMFGLDPDTSMNPFNPFLTIATAVTRRTEGGQVIGPNETITRQQALRMMTIEAARLSFDEARKGSIEVGKLADLTMLSDPILTVPDTKIRAITSEITIVGGRITYERKR